MAESIKDKVVNAGHAVAGAATIAGHKIAEGAGKAVEFVKEKTGMGGTTEGAGKGVDKIKKHMDVIASCGNKVGVVDGVEGETLKLTKKDSADGRHHFIPVAWVDHVDSHVHLFMNSKETEQDWKPDAASCGCS